MAERGRKDCRAGGGGFSWATGMASTSMFKYMEVMWLRSDGKLTGSLSRACRDEEGEKSRMVGQTTATPPPPSKAMLWPLNYLLNYKNTHGRGGLAMPPPARAQDRARLYLLAVSLAEGKDQVSKHGGQLGKEARALGGKVRERGGENSHVTGVKPAHSPQ